MDDQRRNNRQGDRNAQRDRRTLVEFGMDFHGSADPVEIPFHHIQAYPATGEAGHGFNGRESRAKQETEQTVVTGLFGLLVGHESLTERFSFNRREIDPRPIVRDVNVDLPSFVIGIDRQYSGRWLALLSTYLRRFNPILDRMTHQMG
jgi:hypothetical protein